MLTNKPKKHKFSINVTSEQLKMIKYIAEKDCRSIAEVIRMCIQGGCNNYFKGRLPDLKKILEG